jgi:general secretion pathway protein D
MPHGIDACLKRRCYSLLMAVLLAGCTNPSYKDGMNAIAEGRQAEGIHALEKAANDEPRNTEIKATLIRQRSAAVDPLLAEAERQKLNGQLDAAEAAYFKVLSIEPRNTRALQGVEQLNADRRNVAQLQQVEQLIKKGDLLGAERVVRTVKAQDPQNVTARNLQQRIDAMREKEAGAGSNPAVKAALAKPVVLEFRDATLKSVFEVLSRSSGLNFVFDKDVKGDSKVTFFVRNSPLEDIIKLILTTNQLERRQLNDNSFLIYPNTPAKTKEYQELVVRSFYLANTDVKQAQLLVKTVAKSKDVFADEKLNLLIVKDTPDAMRLVERLIESLDLAEPEVMLEVEVLEVTRSRINELGLKWPDSIGYGMLQSQATTTTIVNGVTQSVTTPGGSLASGYIDLKNRAGLTTFTANPGLTLNLKGNNADTNVLANPRIRVKNREKAKIHIGDKLPVFTTTSTANVGVSASVNYLDVGLKLDVEPSVSLDDEVSIKVGLEVSSISKEVTGPSNSLAYQIGTRSTNTVLRLKNGETSVLAGLISDEQRKATSHVPGLGEVPVLGYAFGSQRDTTVKTEIILLITPRIIRNILRPDFGQPAISSGTEAAIGAPPMRVRANGPKSVEMPMPRSGAAVPQRVENPESGNVPFSEAAGDNGLLLAGPGEAAAGSDIEIVVTIPGRNGLVQVDLAYDPTLLEAKLPSATAPGRVTLMVDQGRGALRLHALPNAKGSTRVDVLSATGDGGEPLGGVSASHPIKLGSP